MSHRFLFVSREGYCVELARQTSRQGGDVGFHIMADEFREVGDGFVTKVDDWRSEVDRADVIVFDDTQGAGSLAAELRAAGKHVVGGTPYTDRLEDDRDFGQAELARHGLRLLPRADFDRVEDALDHLRAHPGCYVAKPVGSAQNIKSLVFVGVDDDARDVAHVLETWRSTWADQVERVQLQRRAFGVEVGVGAFFDGAQFVEPINVNFEHKRFFPGDLGPLTGEMGTTMTWARRPPLFTETIARFAPTLRRERYVGYFDLNCIVNADGIWPLELTARFGFPTLAVQLEGLVTTAPALLYNLATGRGDALDVREGAQIGVRLRLPPYPFRDPAMLATYGRDVEIRFAAGPRDGIRIEDAKCVDGRWFTAGTAAAPLVVTAAGDTLPDARDAVYRRIATVRLANVYYRNDIGHSWARDLAALRDWGCL